MSKKIKAMKVAGSSFDRNERFDLRNVPSHFESVSDEEIQRIKDLVMDEVEKISQFKPGTLADILIGVDGHFEGAYNTLKGDYSARLKNLDNAYIKGLAKLRYACDAFELQVAEYNKALEDFSEACEIFNGKALPKNLRFDDNDISEIKRIVGELNERSK